MSDQEQGQGPTVAAGYQATTPSPTDDKEALRQEVGDLGYGLVYGTRRGNLLVFHTPFGNRYTEAEWHEIAKAVADRLEQSMNPRVRAFLSDKGIKQVAIAKSTQLD